MQDKIGITGAAPLTFCLKLFIMAVVGKRGPQPVMAADLYLFAAQFYSDFRALAHGREHERPNEEIYKKVRENLRNTDFCDSQDLERFERREEQIRMARLPESEREKRLTGLRSAQAWELAQRRNDVAYESALEEVRTEGKPEVLKQLLEANTHDEVRRLCDDAFVKRIQPVYLTSESKTPVNREVTVANWPISNGSRLPYYLAKYAEQFIAAKNDPRFPQASSSLRPSTQLKKLWFLSRALAGAVFGIMPRTAVNILGSIRPEELFEQSRAGKPRRKPRK
jgi:hypothetical protein